jgi:hypothetical protein
VTISAGAAAVKKREIFAGLIKLFPLS